MSDGEVDTCSTERFDPLLLVQELHHRTMNEFAIAISSLHLRARLLDREARDALASAADMLRHFADVHRTLQPPVGGTVIDLCDYLDELCDALGRAFLTERGISITMHKSQVYLDVARVWRVGLILMELIINAAKHARWTRDRDTIEIKVRADGEAIHCQIADNGSAGKCGTAGAGTQLVDALVAQLDGKVDRSFGSGGARIIFSFPADRELGRSSAARSAEAAMEPRAR